MPYLVPEELECGIVGAAMLAGGMLWRLWVQRGARAGVRRREPAFDGSYRVVGKAQLPLAH